VIQQIARALNTHEAVLTGQAPVPETATDRAPPTTGYKFSIEDWGTRNALYLISHRYDVPVQQVLELAPFLFCWAAEESLRRRQDRLDELKRHIEEVRRLEREIGHIESSADFNEFIKAESNSIEFKDLFGMGIDVELQSGVDDATENPFAKFLDSLAADFSDVMTFEFCPYGDWPIYRVCEEDAAALVNGDTHLVDHIFGGTVALREMPKEYRWDVEVSTKWVRDKVEEQQKKFRERITTDQGDEGSR